MKDPTARYYAIESVCFAASCPMTKLDMRDLNKPPGSYYLPIFLAKIQATLMICSRAK
jgi:hypothetical protein